MANKVFNSFAFAHFGRFASWRLAPFNTTLDLHMRIIATILLSIWALAVHGSELDFHARVIALYSFSPRKLDKMEIETKSKDIDTFWSSVKASGPSGIEHLRKELVRTDISPFFSYDGAKLLLSLSDTREDRALALKSIARTDLRDIQLDDYFRTVHWFAVNEFDTTEAAFKILSDSKFEVFVPQHYLTLNQEMCLTYMLLPTKEEFYLTKAEKRLFVEKDITAQKSLLGLIADTATKSGDKTLARFASSKNQPEESLKYAKQIIEAIKQMESVATSSISSSSYESLKAEQRKLFARVSDEALDEWVALHVKIRRKGYK